MQNILVETKIENIEKIILTEKNLRIITKDGMVYDFTIKLIKIQKVKGVYYVSFKK